MKGILAPAGVFLRVYPLLASCGYCLEIMGFFYYSARLIKMRRYADNKPSTYFIIIDFLGRGV